MDNERDRLSFALARAHRAIEALYRRLAGGSFCVPREAEDDLIAMLTRMANVVDGLTKASPRSALPTCTGCARRETCKETCDRVTDILPGEFAGRGHREHMCGLQPNLDTDSGRDTMTDRFFIFLNQAHLFTPRQWQVIQLYYGAGKTEADIAKQLNISPASVSERLKRAKRRFELGRMRNSPKGPE